MTIFIKNSGPGRHYPGEPTYTFHGKEVPYLIQWRPTSSITSAILIDISATLDHIGCIDQSNGRKSLLLINGRGNRFQKDFIKYM